MVFQLNKKLIFPDPSLADEDGLLAIGGDLSVARLRLAYQHGIFPWYNEDEPILWYSPHQRFVLNPHQVYISHSMKTLINSERYQIKWDTAFEEVIKNCSKVKRKGQLGTWITDDMTKAYIEMNKQGLAHSVEVWEHKTLVGGLYGVETGKIFCGESMFSFQPNTSKLALIALCQNGKYELIDCQTHTAHLEKMGAKFMDGVEFRKKLKSQ